MADKPTHRTHGLATHGLEAGMGFSRAVTSHLRKRYRERYHGTYRFPRWMFAFDLSLLFIASVLVGVNIYLFQALPPPSKDVRLVLLAPELHSAMPHGLEARVTNVGTTSKNNIRLAWELPPGFEILSSDPAFDVYGQMPIGTLAPGEERSVRIVMRIFQPKGAVRIGFRVTDDTGTQTGSITKQIVGSALVFEPLFPDSKDGGAALADGRIPLRLSNRSSMRLESMTLAGTDRSSVENLEPDQDIVVFGKPGRITASVRGFPIVELGLRGVPPDAGAEVRMSPSTGKVANLEAVMAGPGSVSVFHPGISHPHVRTFAVPTGRTSITVPLDLLSDESAWFAVADVVRGGYGVVAEAPITTPFEAGVVARYYAASGDQIGIGPLPPEVGQTTKYWLNMRLGPTTSDVRDLSLRLVLPEGVSITGRDALADGGGLSQSGRTVIWTVPYLPKQGRGVSAAFEIAFTPTSEMRGRVVPLASDFQAEAVEVQSGLRLTATAPTPDTDLLDDPKASGRGVIR